MMMLRPWRTHRPVRPIVPHLQLEVGWPQLLQGRPLAIAMPASPFGHPVCMVLKGMDTGEAAVAAVAPLRALLTVAGCFASFSCADVASTLWATTMGLVPAGAKAAARAAFPAI